MKQTIIALLLPLLLGVAQAKEAERPVAPALQVLSLPQEATPRAAMPAAPKMNVAQRPGADDIDRPLANADYEAAVGVPATLISEMVPAARPQAPPVIIPAGETLTISDTGPKVHGHWTAYVYDGDLQYAPLTEAEVRENIEWAARYPGEIKNRGRILNPLLQKLEGDNLVVTVGKQMLLDRTFGSATVSSMTVTCVGSGSGAAAAGDTALTASSVCVRFDATPTRAGLVVFTTTTFATTAANFTWNEMSLQNGNANPGGGGTMFNRIVIGPFTKSTAVSIVLSCSVTQS